MNISDKVMYQASVDKNTEFEGVFWMGVKTTGIFCRPTCTARKPKFENVEFFNSTKAAIQKGYRPCKICRPLENPNETPQEIKDILRELSDNASLKFKDVDLVKRGLEPTAIRRWFLKNHGITFHAFQRMFKINAAFKKLNSGEGVLDTAMDLGYESLSGFNESFKNIFGVSPSQSMFEKVVDFKRIETPIGTMIACADEFAFWNFLIEKHWLPN